MFVLTIVLRLMSIIGNLRRVKSNRVIHTLIAADFSLALAGSLLVPVYVIFVTQDISGGTMATAGLATSVFWIAKSGAQFPISWLVDYIEGERDDYVFMLVGYSISMVAALLYFFFANHLWQIYLFEAINGFGYAVAVPAWYGIFTRHIDKNIESTEWTLDSNAMGLGIALAAFIGGLIGDAYGPRSVFLMVAVAYGIGVLMLMHVKRDFFINKKVTEKSAP